MFYKKQIDGSLAPIFGKVEIDGGKFDSLLKLVCQWNRKQITGEQFAQEFWETYNDECLEMWNRKPLRNDPLNALLV